MNCIFCDFANKINTNIYKVYEDNTSLAFLDINPINKGHILLIPKEHNSDIWSMPKDSYSDLLIKANSLAGKLRDIMDSPRVGMVVEGFGVDHVHIHLIPIYKGNELNPERAYKASMEELKEMQEKISNALS